MSATRLKSILAIQLHAHGLPVPERDYHPACQWRADFAWPDYHIALVVVSDRRRYGRQQEVDCERHNAAALAGWTLLHVTPAMIRDGRAYQWVEAIFHWRWEASASTPAQEPP